MASRSEFEFVLTDSTHGLCGQHDPALAVRDIEEMETRLRCLTLGAILAPGYISAARWATLASLQDHWLLDPSQVAYKASPQVLQSMQENGLAPPRHIARVWWQICRGFQGRFKGHILDLLHAEADNATRLQGYLAKSKTTFPVLSGPVISARWLDWIHRIGTVPLTDWEHLKVHLSPERQKNAHVMGIPDLEVHPVIALAIDLWPGACRQGNEGTCSWKDCPGLAQ